MPNLNAVILPAKANKDGKHKVRISVAHNGTTRYIPTTIMLDSANEFKKGSIVKRPDASFLNTKLRGLLQHYQELIDELGFIDGFSCAELINMMKTTETQKHRTLSSVIDEYKEYARIKESTKASYTIAWNAIIKHVKGTTLMDHITPSTIMTFDANLRKKGLASTSIRNYMIIFKTVVNYAVKCGYVFYRVHPFASYKFPSAKVRESWITTEQVKAIRDYKTTNVNLARCRDLFMLSYYLGGINMVDLKRIPFDDKSREIKYVRQKVETRGSDPIKVEFSIPDEAWVIIQKYRGKNGIIKVGSGNGKRADESFLIYYMKKLGEALNIPNLIYYSARKSFSQQAFELGIRDSVIDYLLGHSANYSGVTCLYHYRHVTPEQATEAIRQVLDNLK